MQKDYRKEQFIFISIASFCDPMLVFTVRNALQMARNPTRLAFGIVDQNAASVEHLLPTGDWRTAYILVNPRQSRGACWARSLAMTLYYEEDYFLQIDSHTCFEQDWDAHLIDTLEAISSSHGNEKTIISTRPFSFNINENGEMLLNKFTNNTLILEADSPLLNLERPVVSFKCYDAGVNDDLRGYQISAAFLFTRGSFVGDVPYDPFMYFHGEEQNISVRSFSHGWDIWHSNCVPLYHLYKKRNDDGAALHWSQPFEEHRSEKWHELQKRAANRLSLLLQDRLQGVYGLGKNRSIEEYWKLSGLKVQYL